MIKLLAITIAATALAACSSMSSPTRSTSMGNAPATQNSSDGQAAQQGNRAAVSPGSGAGAGAASGGPAR
jgi:hypothetical protein